MRADQRIVRVLVGLGSALVTFALLWVVTGAAGIRGGDETPREGSQGAKRIDRGSLPPLPKEPEREAPAPDSIRIPSIDVAARVTYLGRNPDGSLEVPKSYSDTGWWSGGPEPGERGAAVITGHVDSLSGAAVFFRLRELNAGDEILVGRPNGTRVRFVVDRTETVDKDEFPARRVYGRTRQAALRVITCTGDFDAKVRSYKGNLIVYARRVGPI